MRSQQSQRAPQQNTLDRTETVDTRAINHLSLTQSELPLQTRFCSVQQALKLERISILIHVCQSFERGAWISDYLQIGHHSGGAIHFSHCIGHPRVGSAVVPTAQECSPKHIVNRPVKRKHEVVLSRDVVSPIQHLVRHVGADSRWRRSSNCDLWSTARCRMLHRSRASHKSKARGHCEQHETEATHCNHPFAARLTRSI